VCCALVAARLYVNTVAPRRRCMPSTRKCGTTKKAARRHLLGEKHDTQRPQPQLNCSIFMLVSKVPGANRKYRRDGRVVLEGSRRTSPHRGAGHTRRTPRVRQHPSGGGALWWSSHLTLGPRGNGEAAARSEAVWEFSKYFKLRKSFLQKKHERQPAWGLDSERYGQTTSCALARVGSDDGAARHSRAAAAATSTGADPNPEPSALSLNP